MKTYRYIAKCACKTLTSALCPEQDMNLPKDSRWRQGPAGVYSHPETGGHVIDCRACGRPAPAKVVRGVFNPKHACNARCLASTSGKCECSCAGKNHGASYGS